MSVEEAFRILLDDPETAGLIEDSYVGHDLGEMGRRFFERPEFVACRELLDRYGVTGGRLLDLGAGNGMATCAWALSGFDVTAVEPDPSDLIGRGAIQEMLEIHGATALVLDGRGEQIGVDPASQDVVYVRQTLHHAEDLDRMLEQIAGTLRPGGILLATREHVVSDAGQLERFLAEHPVNRLAGNEHAYRLEEYRRAIAGAGLTVLEELGPYDSPINYHPATAEEVMERCVKRLGRWVSRPVARRVLRSPARFRSARQRLSRRSRQPGRLYSFLARK